MALHLTGRYSLSNIYDANTTTESITTNDSDSDSILAQPPKDLNYYRAELTGLWRKTAEDIIATGRVFSQAKNDLTPGEYKVLMAEFGFDRAMVSRLRTIYACLKDVANSQHLKLPASVSTLLEMIKKGPELLEAKLRRGEWSTTTTRADIVPRKPKEPKQEPSPVNHFRQFYQGKHRKAMIDELVNNPVLCETVSREIEELMEAVRERRRQGNGQDEAAIIESPAITPRHRLKSRFSYGV
jgi:hypothetical protein